MFPFISEKTRRHLRCRPLRHHLAGGRAAHVKGVAGACRALLGLIP